MCDVIVVVFLGVVNMFESVRHRMHLVGEKHVETF